MIVDFDYDFLKLEAKIKMEEAIKAYKYNISKIQTGKANPQILNLINIDYFGDLTPLSQLANISSPNPKQLLIKPYDTTIVKKITSIIKASGLGVQPIDEGDKIRMTFPELTTDRRKELVKSLVKYTEQAKIKVRNARQEINKLIKLSKESEDVEKKMFNDIQKLTDNYIQKINLITKEKEGDLMQI